MAWVGAIVGLAGGVMGASGTAAAGRDAQAAYDTNAIIAFRNGKLAREAAAESVLDLKRVEKRVLGSQRAAYAASGVVGDSGSALDVLAESTALALMDQQRRTQQGEREAMDFENQALLGHATGAATAQAAQTSASAQLLSSVGSAASNLYRTTT